MVRLEQVAFPIIDEKNVAHRGVVAVFLNASPGVEGIDPLLGDGHVGEAERVGTVVGHVDTGFFLDVDDGVTEADHADTLDGRADDAAEVDEAAIHVGADEGGLVRADAENVAGIKDGLGTGQHVRVVLVARIVEEVSGGLVV